ncbi:hypothetical protein I4U23_016574 [Adineta vaga]|nr:hypothetical protein I4U23_016574 [Adineta vaga]
MSSSYEKFLQDLKSSISKIPNALSPLQYILENKLISSDGLIIECGVGSALTTNYIAKNINANRIVYGFDSFQGLPEDWSPRPMQKGAYKQSTIPVVEDNIKIITGMFEDTLPDFVNNHINAKIALLHVDCDIYSSTKTVFDYLGKLLGPKSIIVFDEFWHYDGYENHECKAFYEWLINENKLNSIQWIGYCGDYDGDYYIKNGFISYGDIVGPTFPLNERVAVQLF